MKLENFLRKENFAPAIEPPQRFGCEIQRPGVINLQEDYAHNRMVQGVTSL